MVVEGGGSCCEREGGGMCVGDSVGRLDDAGGDAGDGLEFWRCLG